LFLVEDLNRDLFWKKPISAGLYPSEWFVVTRQIIKACLRFISQLDELKEGFSTSVKISGINFSFHQYLSKFFNSFLDFPLKSSKREEIAIDFILRGWKIGCCETI
jgi:hypothetical protein